MRTRTGSDITYLRFAFTGELGMHHAHCALDDGIVRSVWLTLDELKATAHLHRSPIVLESVDYLAGQRHDLGLVHADSSIYRPYSPRRPCRRMRAPRWTMCWRRFIDRCLKLS